MNEPIHEERAEAELPRLRIHHFFVLTTVFAVVMSVQLGLWRFVSSLEPDTVMPKFSNGITLLFIVQTLLQSVCISVCLLGFAWRRREKSFPSQPGHWMAAHTTITCVLGVLFSMAAFSSGQGIVHDSIAWVTKSVFFAFHCFSFALWVAAYLYEPTRIWKLGWAAMAFKSLLSILWALIYVLAKCVEWLLEVFWYNAQFDWQLYFPWGSSVLPGYALLAFLPVASIIDLRQHRLRHWSHWLMVVSTFVSTVIMTVYYHLAFR